jgi:5-methylcytosine-specific restriction endonuclease McrA
MLAKGKAGRKKRNDTYLCHFCRKARHTRHGVSAGMLAVRDGTDCGICSQPVDMTLRYPDPMAAQVDHIVPYALGGSHDEENLQLAHHRCNSLKHARVNFTLHGAPA